MPIYLNITVDDPFDAHDLAHQLVTALRHDGLAMGPVADGKQGTLLFEFMEMATPLIPVHENQLAQKTARMVQQGQVVTLQQDRRNVPLTANEAHNQTLIHTHASGNSDITIAVH